LQIKKKASDLHYEFVPKRQTRLHLFQRIRVLQQKFNPKDVERNIKFKNFKINLETLTDCVKNQHCIFCSTPSVKSSFFCEIHYDEHTFVLYNTALALPVVPLRRDIQVLESEGHSAAVRIDEIHVPEKKILYFDTKDTNVTIHSLFKNQPKGVVSSLAPCLFPHLGVPAPEFPPQAEKAENQSGIRPNSYYGV